MSSEDSDIEMKSALTKKQIKKMPTSPTEELLDTSHTELPTKNKKLLPKKKDKNTKKKQELSDESNKDNLKKEDVKKLTTKLMVNHALKDLKSRKGVSLYAIKKYLKENYEVNTEKTNYIIKNAIKKSVEDGTIVQTKGTGASGSFKLAPGKPDKPSKPKKPKMNKEDKEKLKIMMKSEKSNKLKENLEKLKKVKSKEGKTEDVLKKKMIVREKKVDVEKADGEKKEKKPKMKSAKRTPTATEKRAAMIKRKSIGTIIKPPKMKPKARG